MFFEKLDILAFQKALVEDFFRSSKLYSETGQKVKNVTFDF